MERSSAIITAAINQRNVLRLTYPPGVRLIEPHAFGWISDRKLLIRAYQTEGARLPLLKNNLSRRNQAGGVQILRRHHSRRGARRFRKRALPDGSAQPAPRRSISALFLANAS